MNTPEQRIKIALQKSGRLTDHSLDLLARCGLNFTQSKDQLFCYGENMPVDLLLVRDDDIPGLVSDEVCDLGIAGLNVIQEKRLGLQKNGKPALFDQVYALDFGHCRLAISAPAEADYCGPQSLQNARIATSYTAQLMNAGVHRIAQKIGEEGVEVALAASKGHHEEINCETADLIYHVLVLLQHQDLSFSDIAQELEGRHRKN